MNDDFTDLENELRTLRPQAASEHLTDRIHALIDRLPSPHTRTTWWQRLGFNRPSAAIGWGVLSPALSAAVVVALVHLTSSTPLPHPPGVHFPPGPDEAALDASASSAHSIAGLSPAVSAKSTNVLYQRLDEGVVFDGGQEPVRRLRYRSADLVEWRNPKTGANWEVSYPREDVVLVPIQVQ